MDTATRSESNLESMPVEPGLLDRANWWFDISWYGLLVAGAITAIAACATVAFLFVQYWSSGVRETHSEWRTSALELQTEDAKRDTAAALERIAVLNKETARLSADAEASKAAVADANARALEAQAELAKFKAPRVLTSEQTQALARALSPFKGQRASVGAVPATFETVSLSQQIALALKVAEVNVDVNQMAAEAQVGVVRGVVAVATTGNEKGERFASEFAKAINDVGLQGSWTGGMMESIMQKLEKGQPGWRNREGNDWVIIVVGDKP